MSQVVCQLRHAKWGPCQLLRVEATDWIVKVESTGVTFRVRPENRCQFEIAKAPPPRASSSAATPSPISLSTSVARKARRAIESLRIGLPSLDGTTRELAVGFDDISRLIDCFLRDIADDGGGAMVLKGEYGQGKTFALHVLEEMALEAGFLTTRTEIDATENRLCKPHHVYRSLVQNLRMPKVSAIGTLALVEQTVRVLEANGLREPTQREAWLLGRLGCMPLAWLLSDPCVLKKPHLLGILNCDPSYPAGWARMFHVNPPPSRYWPAFNAGTQGDFASFVLSGLGRLARVLGYKGLVIVLDEMEKWHDLNWNEQIRAGNLLGGLIWGATSELGKRGKYDNPSCLQHSNRCNGYPFTTEQMAHIGVALAMTPRDAAHDPEAIWCDYGPVLIGHVPRFANEELKRYATAVTPLFARAYGLEPPTSPELAWIVDEARQLWKRHGDLTTRSGVQAVIAAFDRWREQSLA